MTAPRLWDRDPDLPARAFTDPDTGPEPPAESYGRLKEAARITGYTLERAIAELEDLLEDGRFMQIGRFADVNEFMRDAAGIFGNLYIDPVTRKRIAERVQELQPGASQRAIAGVLGVTKMTVSRDLRVTNVTEPSADQTRAPAAAVTNVTEPAPDESAADLEVEAAAEVVLASLEEDPKLAAARMRTAWAKAALHVRRDLLPLKPEAVAVALGDIERDAAARLLLDLEEWLRALEAAYPKRLEVVR